MQAQLQVRSNFDHKVNSVQNPSWCILIEGAHLADGGLCWMKLHNAKAQHCAPSGYQNFEERGHLTTILHAYSSQLEGVPTNIVNSPLFPLLSSSSWKKDLCKLVCLNISWVNGDALF